MTTGALSLLIGLAYRLARRTGNRWWWAVVALALWARWVEGHRPVQLRSRYRVRPGRELDVAVGDRPAA